MDFEYLSLPIHSNRSLFFAPIYNKITKNHRQYLMWHNFWVQIPKTLIFWFHSSSMIQNFHFLSKSFTNYIFKAKKQKLGKVSLILLYFLNYSSSKLNLSLIFSDLAFYHSLFEIEIWQYTNQWSLSRLICNYALHSGRDMIGENVGLKLNFKNELTKWW